MIIENKDDLSKLYTCWYVLSKSKVEMTGEAMMKYADCFKWLGAEVQKAKIELEKKPIKESEKPKLIKKGKEK